MIGNIYTRYLNRGNIYPYGKQKTPTHWKGFRIVIILDLCLGVVLMLVK